MRRKFTSHSVLETKSLGAKLACLLKGGEVLALRGNLGSGKTTFLKGLAKGLGIKHRIVSPTFVIYRPYPLPNSPSKTLVHFDLYRLKGSNDLEELGLIEILGHSQYISAIEWPERAEKSLPANAIYLHFSLGKHPSQRIIKLCSKKSLSF